MVRVEGGELRFSLVGGSAPMANGVRRALLADVPVISIHDVSIRENGTALSNELLPDRLFALHIFAPEYSGAGGTGANATASKWMPVDEVARRLAQPRISLDETERIMREQCFLARAYAAMELSIDVANPTYEALMVTTEHFVARFSHEGEEITLHHHVLTAMFPSWQGRAFSPIVRLEPMVPGQTPFSIALTCRLRRGSPTDVGAQCVPCNAASFADGPVHVVRVFAFHDETAGECVRLAAATIRARLVKWILRAGGTTAMRARRSKRANKEEAEEEVGEDWYAEMIRAAEDDLIHANGWLCFPAPTALSAWIAQHVAAPVRMLPSPNSLEGCIDIHLDAETETVAALIAEHMTDGVLFLSVLRLATDTAILRIALDARDPHPEPILTTMLADAAYRALERITQFTREFIALYDVV